MSVHNGYWHWLPPGMGWLVLFLIFLFWLLVVLAIAHLARKLSPPPSESSSEILNKRYAQGEIDREVFQRMKKEIETEER